MDRKRIKVNDYEIEYIVGGNDNDKTMIFAHGLGGSCDQWIKQVEHFGNKYKVIAFSLHGHGSSYKPESLEEYTIKKYADTAYEVLKKLKVSSCIWVGNSMGGVIGYEIIKMHPGIIETMFTNGTTPSLQMSKAVVSTVKYMDKIMIKLMGLDSYIKFAAKNSSKSVDAQNTIYNFMMKTSKEAVIGSHVALGDYNYLDIIKGTKKKIHIIRCPYDKDINRYLDKYKDEIGSNPNVLVIRLDNAGHIANVEIPNEYNKVIEKYK